MQKVTYCENCGTRCGAGGNSPGVPVGALRDEVTRALRGRPVVHERQAADEVHGEEGRLHLHHRHCRAPAPRSRNSLQGRPPPPAKQPGTPHATQCTHGTPTTPLFDQPRQAGSNHGRGSPSTPTISQAVRQEQHGGGSGAARLVAQAHLQGWEADKLRGLTDGCLHQVPAYNHHEAQ